MSFGENIVELVSKTDAPLVQKASWWSRVPLGNIADILNGYPFASQQFNLERGAPVIRIRDVTSGKTETKYSGDIPEGYWIEAGDYIVGMDGDFNARVWNSERGLLNQRVCKLSADRQFLDPSFLAYVLPGYLKLINDHTPSVTVKHLSSRTLQETPIPLPPLPEQRRIVRKLDTLSARSTTARTHLTAIEKLVERMRGAVLSQALNGRLVASQLDCGEPTELGQFITGIEQGWSPKCENEPELDPTKWAVLTTTAIQAITFDSAENKRLPESLSPRPHLEVEAGDVLMTRAGPRVRCAVCCFVAETVPRRIFSDKIYRIRLDKSVEPEFFAMMMNAPEMVRALDAIKSGGSESGLNLTQDRLKSLAINIWDRPTQVEVVADIKRQFAKIDRLAAEAAKALKLLGHLDQRILAKAFAGDLVPQDPTDEPAETLLARIVEARATTPKGKKRRRAVASD